MSSITLLPAEFDTQTSPLPSMAMPPRALFKPPTLNLSAIVQSLGAADNPGLNTLFEVRSRRCPSCSPSPDCGR